MKIEEISSPGGGDANEDLIAVFEEGASTHILVLDGGTSVADRAYIDEESGDAAWLMRNFAEALQGAIPEAPSQESAVLRALDEVFARFQAATRGVEVPLYAWPVGAATWVRVTGSRLEAYCVGDCKLLLQHANGRVTDLDPYVNPQEDVLREAIAGLVERGITDPETRMAHLLPMLRARREFMNTAEVPPALCMRPQGPFPARSYAADVGAGAALLGMSDGFYRLVDPYGLHNNATLLAACRDLGLPAVLAQLRNHENGSGGALAVKNADDASAVLCTF
ncbi:protein phosphatase 2C domain-containing protein [Massilia endophytica]|uniref:protein phosphatase 2C domain-containing protein n=1 Tax=Massilia endophytica TaxID=2899220 RepID=UPI001E343CA4|nr:protein phosphatase 2C domain-containing protein [Massilia endophytica]UGQ49099.1 protein phosphatase 2C domain-containing protein [Massilia endophytica]